MADRLREGSDQEEESSPPPRGYKQQQQQQTPRGSDRRPTEFVGRGGGQNRGGFGSRTRQDDRQRRGVTEEG